MIEIQFEFYIGIVKCRTNLNRAVLLLFTVFGNPTFVGELIDKNSQTIQCPFTVLANNFQFSYEFTNPISVNSSFLIFFPSLFKRCGSFIIAETQY